MPWMCLERCNETKHDIQANLKDIQLHKHLLSGVAFELFNLGPHSTLVTNDLTQVSQQISSFGLQTFAMISSYPYPPQFLSWMEEVFKNPNPFFDQCLAAAKKYSLTGFNVDWEPTKSATQKLALDYVNFLDNFADVLHKNGYKLTMDMGSWNAIWNITLLGQSKVDTVMTMQTYTGNFDIFSQNLKQAVDSVPMQKLGIGLQVLDTFTKQNYTKSELKQRFNEIKKYDVQQIDIWRMPIFSEWWDCIEELVKLELLRESNKN